jgi:hypothetical protein
VYDLDSMKSLPYAPIPSDGIHQWVWALRKMPAGSMNRALRLRRILIKVLRARIGLKEKITQDIPFNTSPFLSSSHILYKSDLIIARGTLISDEHKKINSISGKEAVVAIYTPRIEEFYNYVIQNNVNVSNWDVFVIRGNSFFSYKDFEDFEIPFRNMFIHNLLGTPIVAQKIRPLPLGINPNLVSKPGYFDLIATTDIFKSKQVNSCRLILMNFDCSTNLSSRELAIQQLKGSKNVDWVSQIPSTDIFPTYSRYLFVISPPGAGPDCYRTWEAIYAGAIPIVLDSETPHFHEDYPLWRVNDWSQLNEWSASQIREKYLEIANQSFVLPLTSEFGLG